MIRRLQTVPVFLFVLAVLMSACGDAGNTAATTTVDAVSSTATLEQPSTTGTTSSTAAGTVSSTTTRRAEPTTPATTTPAPTLTGIETWLSEGWTDSVPGAMWGPVQGWTCRVENPGPSIDKGTVLTCRPAPEPADSQFPLLTVLVLDGAGTVAVGQAGVVYPVLSPDSGLYAQSGLFCRDVLGESDLTRELPDPNLRYFGSVLYWFMEGMPARMDADEDGIPCETLSAPEVVESLWDGGWVEGTSGEAECSASALLAGAGSLAAPNAAVAEFACAPASLGDIFGGWAWAWVVSPDQEPLVVFFSSYGGSSDDGPLFGDWAVVASGDRSLVCPPAEGGMPEAVCDYLCGQLSEEACRLLLGTD
jgi:hypothetical protein